MSRRKVFRLLQDLGGRATSKELKKAARRCYPGTTLYKYVSVRLKALEELGVVRLEGDEWVIVSEYISRR